MAGCDSCRKNASSHSWPRRIFRLFSFILVLLLVYLLLVAFNFEWVRRVPVEYTYGDRLEITVASCDVLIRAGSARKVKVEGLLHEVSVAQTMATADVVRIVNAQNLKGCDAQPKRDCTRLCRVIADVPADSPPDTLWIQQLKDDKADHVVVDIQDVMLNNLMVRGSGGNWWDKAGPSIEVFMHGSTTQGYMYITLAKGQASLQNNTHRGTADVRSDGSVTMREVAHAGPVNLNWRQPNNQICVVAAPDELVLPDENGPLALCSSTYFKSQFQVFYDSSKDFFLDRAEFGAQLAKMPYCCGSNCPHSTWCDGTLYPIFDFGSIETGASLNSRAEILSAATVFENVKQLGYAGMVPFCFREAQLMMPRNNTRTVEGWPDFVPKADDATAPVVVTFASCVRHTDCKTGYCDSTTSTCAPDPSVVFSIVTGSWGGCDKPCGGGQQIRDRVCLGSDGLKYPSYLCPGLTSSTDVQACNTHVCSLPLVPTDYSFGLDKDLRSNWIDITVTGTLPTNATAFEIRLGSSFGAMLDTYVVEVLQSECVDAGYCTIQASSQLPAYVDRLMLMGKNSDGLGPAVAEVFTDRVGETGSQQLFTVQSEAGMVHFHLAGASSTSGSWAPADRLPGIRMHLPDARRLMRTAGARFGDPQSSDHGVVVIDTVAVPGIPATRWIYATRPVFLSMDPALMTFLSAGLLKPEIMHFRVSFLDLSCSTTSAAVNGIPSVPSSEDYLRDDVRERLTAMYDQLQRALRSDGLATRARIRGELVLLDPDHRVKPYVHKYWEFYDGADDEEVLMRLRKSSALAQLQDTAVGLSLACGALVSLLATYICFKLARRALKVLLMEKRAKKAMLRRKLGETKDTEEDEQDKQVYGNPFLQPLVLIDMLIMEPIYMHLLNSLARFCHERVVVDHQVGPRAGKVVPAPEGDLEKKTPSAKEVDNRKFIYMRRFRAEYEEYCIEHGLEAITNRDEIMRFLVNKFDLRSTRETIWRIRGVRWRRKEEAVPASKPLEEGEPKPSSLWRFCDQHMVVTKDRRKFWLDYQNHRLPSGKMQIGVKQQFLDWCTQKNEPPVSMDAMDPLSPESEMTGLTAWAESQGLAYQEVEVQRILNCYLSDQPQLSLSWRQLVADFVQVLVHICILILPAVVISANALAAQQVYARTMVTDVPVQMMDVLGTALPYIGFDAGGRQVLFQTSFVLAVQFVYLILAIIRVLLHYVMHERCIKKIYDWIFAIVLCLEVLGFMAWVGLTAAWCILATILSPTSYLPYGTAVIVFCLVILSLWKELTATAASMQKKVFAMVDEKLQGCLKAVKDEMEMQSQSQAMVSALGKLKAEKKKAAKKVDESQSGFDEYQQEKKKRKVTPGDVFCTLDADSTGTLSIDEFRKLFAAMDSSMDPKSIDKMFAYADSDGSGLVSQDEFEEAWNFLVEHLVQKVLAELGFGPLDIIFAIGMSVVTMICFFLFIFFAMQGWYNDTSFQACVQSALVAGSGKVATIVRQRAPDQDDANLGNLATSLEGGDAGDAGEGDGDGGGEGGEGGEGGGEGGG